MDDQAQIIVKKIIKNVKVEDSKVFLLKSITSTAHENIRKFLIIVQFYRSLYDNEEYKTILH